MKELELYQKEMQSVISKEEIDFAFDQRFPKEMKKKLNQSKVAIAGLGGLGSNIALMLARSGVGHLFLVDYDVVDVTNLNRQAYSVEHIGKKKTEALFQMLCHVNPYLKYEVQTIKVTEDRIQDLFTEYPFVCEAFDDPAQKAMLVNGLLLNCRNTIVISGNGMAGYSDTNDILTTKQLSRLYVCGDLKTDIKDGIGLMSPRVSACAAHQANKVIQLIMEEKRN